MQRLAVLRQLVSPEFGVDAEVDWNSVERVWGTRFPADYMEFMRWYGVGTFNDSLHVTPPPSGDAVLMEEATSHLAGGLEWLGRFGDAPPWGAFPSRPGLIRWGSTTEGDDGFWLVSDSDPDLWPVVVWNRGSTTWAQYAPGMVDLLVRLVSQPESSDEIMTLFESKPGRPIRFVSDRIKHTLLEPWPDLAED